jgi:type II secretory pathway component HofQ
VNVVLKSDQTATVTLRLQEVSLYTALEMTVRAAGYQMEIREHLVFVSLGVGQIGKPVRQPLKSPKPSQ